MTSLLWNRLSLLNYTTQFVVLALQPLLIRRIIIKCLGCLDYWRKYMRAFGKGVDVIYSEQGEADIFSRVILLKH